MIRSTKCVFAAVIFSFVSSFVSSSSATAGITLSGSEYFQNFNGIGSGLPTGVSLSQVANSTAAPWGISRNLRGSGTTFSHVGWTDTASDFRNSASPTASDSSVNPDRLIAVRQGTSSGITTPSFAFSFDNTIEKSDFKLDLDFWVLQKNNRNTTWTIRWATHSSITTFTTISTFTPTAAGKIELRNLAFGDAFSNSTEAKYIQIVATGLSSSGTDTRDVFGLDNFRLKFTPQAVPEPSSVFLVGLLAIGFASLRPSRSQR